MKKQRYVPILVLLAVAIFLPGLVTGEMGSGEPLFNYSFDESHSLIYQQMLEQNASVGEYYERVCPEFLEDMPPEVKAHLYNTTMKGYQEFVPPGKRVAVAIASPVMSVCGVPIPLAIIGLAGIGILALFAAFYLIRERIRNGKR